MFSAVSFCLDFDLSCKNDCRHLWNKVQLSSILNWFSELVEKVYSVVRSQNYSVTLCAVHANAGSSKALPRYSLGQTTLHCNTVYGTHGLTVHRAPGPPCPTVQPARVSMRPIFLLADWFCKLKSEPAEFLSISTQSELHILYLLQNAQRKTNKS